jgi:predicted nicotinamide N-methyase
MAGAAGSTANDIDPFCEAAVGLNAALNGVSVEYRGEDLLGKDLREYDVIVAGDICYEPALATRARAWLERLARGGVEVLIGDPGRAAFREVGLERLARYRVSEVPEYEDGDVRRAKVFRLNPIRQKE